MTYEDYYYWYRNAQMQGKSTSIESAKSYFGQDATYPQLYQWQQQVYNESPVVD